MENNQEGELISLSNFELSTTEAQDRALIDKQISTAKQYPRNLHRVRDNVIAIASMDEETAKSCGYALPRGGKNLTGPSVHLARIVAQQYGNIRVDAKISNIDATHVTGQATCIDLENNVGIRVEVKRKIIDKNGLRFNEDMITVTGNAASSIALRNAVYNVVPKPIIDAGYKAAQQKITGDISDETKLLAKRKAVLDGFLKTHGVSEADVLKTLGLREPTQIKGEEIAILIGLAQAIKDGDTTVDETFYPEKGSNSNLIPLSEIKEIFETKKDKLSPEELKNALRIIDNKEVNSYKKLHEILNKL